MSFTHDANGNMISKTDVVSTEVTTYQYDYENRLKRIDYPDGTYNTYEYDPFGNRIKKDVNGTVIWFLYDFSKLLPDVIAEYDQNKTAIAKYTHGPEIDEIISMRKDDKSYFYLRDGLGSIADLTDSTETVVNTYQYDTFGNIVNESGTIYNPYGYTGRRFDTVSGLMYFRARYYSPATGRFISEDPIRFLGESNLYRYGLNNPTNKKDPTGLRVFEIGIDLEAVFGAGVTGEANYVWDNEGRWGFKVCLNKGGGLSWGGRFIETYEGQLKRGPEIKAELGGHYWYSKITGKSEGVVGGIKLLSAASYYRNKWLKHIKQFTGCPDWNGAVYNKFESKENLGFGAGAAVSGGLCGEWYF